ncbi:cadherin domain-containing protein [Microvirga sp. CF3062]|uniref:cadherin domain-containing protein n=1 Tax=Microvirga sp. CF3062 TaxID=3110182 RepID=UPI002E792371|nr:cadherin domain-containing protein [Microvirga sp. CF3062]MEE1655043.1 cadherin domain-containing protein [Microvirga sp. CF3062]
MAHRFVTGIDTDGEILGENDSLTVLTGGAITVATAGGSGIVSTGLGASATVFGGVAADTDGIRLEGTESRAFVGRSGNVTGGRFGVLIGSNAAFDISLRNEGTITGYIGGVRLEGLGLDLVNAGTISVPAGAVDIPIAAVTLASTGGTSNLVNTGSIIAGPSGNHSAIVGGLGNDIVSNAGLIRGKIVLGAGNDRYYGQEGFSEFGSISLGTGQNIAYGGIGRETFELIQDGDRLEDFVDGGEGIDSLVLFDGAMDVSIDLRLTLWQDTGVGGLTLRNVENLGTASGNDRLTGNAEDNDLSAGLGNDTLDGGLGHDILRGGSGNDTALFFGAAGATVDLRLTGSQNTGYGFDRLSGIETLVGGAGDDVFTGDGAANLLSGSGGNDILQGGGGDDTLDGGAGVDTAVFSGAKAGYQITSNGDGSVTVAGPDGTDTVRNVRFLKFSDGLTTLTNAAPTGLAVSSGTVVENAPAGSVAASLSATDADGDAISYTLVPGSSSAFAIVGNSLVVTGAIDFETTRQHAVTVQAKDAYGGIATTTVNLSVINAVETTPFTLRGTSVADSLTGEAGGDTFYGGLGNDVLAGGAGKDVFVFDTRLNKRTNVDKIADFRTQDDSIYLENKIFTKLGSGTFSKPKKFTSDMFVQNTKAQDAEDRIVYDKKTGKLYYDEDGTGSKAQVQIATITNKAVLKYSDFFVI